MRGNMYRCKMGVWWRDVALWMEYGASFPWVSFCSVALHFPTMKEMNPFLGAIFFPGQCDGVPQFIHSLPKSPIHQKKKGKKKNTFLVVVG